MAVVYPFIPTPYHKELYEAHGPLNFADASFGFPWYIFCGAVASMFDQIETYARDQADGTPGWGILLDVDRCPEEALPWLAQFVGVTLLPAQVTAQQKRDRIRGTDGFKRGSLGAIVAATQAHLTGTKTVFLKERDPSVSSLFGGAYGLQIITYTNQTPDYNQTLADIIAQKPGGIVLNYQTVDGQTYLAERTSYTNYQGVKNAYLTYAGMRNNEPGT